MMMRVRAVIGVGVAWATLVAAVASAQHATPSGTSASLAAEPYSIEVFGVFRDLMLQGDFTPKVAIGLVMSRLPSTGVGAVSGARGEITIVDGKLIISYGNSDAPPTPNSETAALLATGKVKEWQSVPVGSDVAPPGCRSVSRAIGQGPWSRSRTIISLPVARDSCALRHARERHTD
jgi:hypothetical protein